MQLTAFKRDVAYIHVGFDSPNKSIAVRYRVKGSDAGMQRYHTLAPEFVCVIDGQCQTSWHRIILVEISVFYAT